MQRWSLTLPCGRGNREWHQQFLDGGFPARSDPCRRNAPQRWGCRASAPSNTSGSGSSLGLGLHIGIAVLRDDGVDALGTSQRESESHWRAVIKHVNREALETD